MDLEQIKKLIEKEIPEGISSKLSFTGSDVMISDNMHQAGSIDMLHATNEINKVIDMLLMHGYIYECLQYPSDSDARYRIKITGKNDIDESIIIKKKQQKELLAKISELRQNPNIQDELINLIKSAMDKGFDINTEFENTSSTLLNKLCKYEKLVLFLISQGADIKKYGGSALSDLLSRSSDYRYNFPIAKILIEAGADINYCYSSPVLYEAVDKCENKDRNSDYCGHANYYKACYEAFDYLLSKGADPNIQCYNGETCLMKAVENENIYLTEQLLKHGADKSLKSKYDRNPLDYVKNPTIKKLLSKK